MIQHFITVRYQAVCKLLQQKSALVQVNMSEGLEQNDRMQFAISYVHRSWMFILLKGYLDGSTYQLVLQLQYHPPCLRILPQSCLSCQQDPGVEHKSVKDPSLKVWAWYSWNGMDLPCFWNSWWLSRWVMVIQSWNRNIDQSQSLQSLNRNGN